MLEIENLANLHTLTQALIQAGQIQQGSIETLELKRFSAKTYKSPQIAFLQQ